MFCLHDDRQKSHHRCANKNITYTYPYCPWCWAEDSGAFRSFLPHQRILCPELAKFGHFARLYSVTYDWHCCFWVIQRCRCSRTRAAYFCLSTAQTWWLRMLVFIYSGRCFSHLYKVDTKSFFIHLSCLCRSTPHQPSQDQDHCPVVHLCAFCSDELWSGFWFVKQDQTTMTIALLYCWAELWLDLLVGSRSWCRDIDSGVWSQECWWHYYSWKPIHYAKCRHCPPRPQWRCSRSLSVSPFCAWVLGRGHTLAEKSL